MVSVFILHFMIDFLYCILKSFFICDKCAHFLYTYISYLHAEVCVLMCVIANYLSVLECNMISRANGSAYMEMGNTKLICSV